MEILELTLLTNNLVDTKKFYELTMGFEKIDESDNSLTFQIGFSQLKFELTKNGKNPKYHFALNIPQNKIEEAIIWTTERTQLIKTVNKEFVVDFENWQAKSIYFYDNNRNILEFICRTDLCNASEIEFSVNSFININEIGLVTENPLWTSDKIIEETKAEYFSKGPKGESFSAVGNEIGLFVISSPNRNWFPTQDLAEKWKVKSKVKIDNNEFELEFN